MATTLDDPPRPAGAPGHALREIRSGVLSWVERQMGLTPAGLGVLGVAATGLVVGRALASRGLTLTAYGLLSGVVIPWLLGRRMLNLRAERSKLPGRVRPGVPVDVEVRLAAGQHLSTLVVEEEMDPRVGPPVRIAVPVLPRGDSVVQSYRVAPAVRGVYDIGPLVAEWSDPFGLIRRRQRIGDAERIIVHPRVEPVLDRILTRAWEDPPVRPPVSKPWPTGFEFYGMREYVPGDDPRRIVWRAVARHDRYLVRESEQGITDRVNIVLDTERGSHSPGVVSETFETAVVAAASLARMYLREGFSVTIDGND
ncbi:MAG: DUF58 domain-containing protein, partial [Actinobacteria bacterium]|nr:DUF58 domain-containing protein [Actinomycetota bacterium]